MISANGGNCFTHGQWFGPGLCPICIQSTKITTMTSSPTGGLRYNKGKAKLSLVPSSLEEAVAEVIWNSSDKAGGKYPLDNWRKGLSWSEVGESLLRHAKAFIQEGEDLDKESGLNHLKHVACNVAFLIEYLKTHPELDDRRKK